MKKEIMIDGGDMATMSLEYVNDGTYHGTAGFVHGQLLPVCCITCLKKNMNVSLSTWERSFVCFVL